MGTANRSLFLVIVAFCSFSWARAAAQSIDAKPFDHVYWSRTHNTYDATRIARITDPLFSQYRVIEIDVHPTKAQIPTLVTHCSSSGGFPLDLASRCGVSFPVQHNPGPYPNRNNCNGGQGGDLRSCLRDIRRWIEQHPGREPITILLDIKGDWGGFVGGHPRETQLQIAGLMNNVLGAELGSTLFRPSDLARFQGQDPRHADLRRGVIEQGWPTVRQLRGKVIVLMTGGLLTSNPINGEPWDMNDTLEEYIEATEWGVHANAFVCPIAIVPSNFDWNNRAEDFDDSRSNRWVVCGTVRGSADSWTERTLSAARNRQLSNLWDLDGSETTNMHLAIAYKSSFIQRDNPAFNGYALNGVRGSRSLDSTIEIGAGTGGELRRAGTFNTAWVGGGVRGAGSLWRLTEKRQLVSPDNPEYCLDVQGAHNGVEHGDFVHMFRCDGGRSERWRITSSGHIYNDDGGLCLQASNIPGRSFQVVHCVAAGHAAYSWQRFFLRALSIN